MLHKLIAVILALGIGTISQAQITPSQNVPKTHAALLNVRTFQPQQVPYPSQRETLTIHIDADEVILNCTVLDEKGELVKDLKKDNFTVSENKSPQKVISFQQQDTPVSIGLLIDNSGSMRSKHASVAAAALDLIKASNPLDETFVINFSDQEYLDQEFTSDLDLLRAGLSRMNSSGGTSLYDTIIEASSRIEKSAHLPRRILIRGHRRRGQRIEVHAGGRNPQCSRHARSDCLYDRPHVRR